MVASGQIVLGAAAAVQNVDQRRGTFYLLGLRSTKKCSLSIRESNDPIQLLLSNPHQDQADRDPPPTRPRLARRGLACPRAASATACGDTTSQGSTARLNPRARDSRRRPRLSHLSSTANLLSLSRHDTRKLSDEVAALICISSALHHQPSPLRVPHHW